MSAQPLEKTPEPAPRPTEPPALARKRRQRGSAFAPSSVLSYDEGQLPLPAAPDRAVVFVVSHVTAEGVPRTLWKRFEWSDDIAKMMKFVEDATEADRRNAKDRGVEWHPMEFHIDSTDPECRHGWRFLEGESLVIAWLRVLMVECVCKTIEFGAVMTRTALSDESLTGDGVRWVFKSVVEA